MRNILLVIDMQNDFVDGALGTKEAEAIVDNVVEKIKSYDPEDVYATRDTHQPDYMDTQEGKFLPVVHCVEGTPGWELNAKIAPLIKEDHIINKPTFGGTDMAELIESIAEKEDISLEIIGLCTDICVISNALLLKAKMPEIPIKVDPACCAGVTPEKHEAALETMRSCQIIM